MALIDVPAREIHAKIVFFGPELSGKTTSLSAIAAGIPPDARGEFRAIAAESARTIFSDSLSIDLGEHLGFHLRCHLYTVPGQARSSGPRAAVLHGADGVVFVADATPLRMAENMNALAELRQMLERQHKPLADIPLVLECNKSDLPDATPPAALAASLDLSGRPAVRAVAINGEGVFDALRAITKLVAANL